MKHISILGSTGSIGTQTLDVLNEHASTFVPDGLAAGRNFLLLAEQIRHFSPRIVSVKSSTLARQLTKKIGRSKTEIVWGDSGNIIVATLPEVEQVVVSTPGLPGIMPTLKAIRAKKTIALATKEVLVAAGSIITQEAKRNGVSIFPIDSEHSAIFQCLEGRSIDEVSRVFLTCSGGPFRGMRGKELKRVTLKQALNHPSWRMGQKITIDSATLMNKGFEVLEAFWLFGIPLEKIKVIIHPQSVIHSAVEFVDGTIIAQLGPADMRLPIQHALFYPEKRQGNSFKRFSFSDYPNMNFEHPDKETFRCLSMAYEAGRIGGTAPAVLNAANDIVVEAFLKEKLEFYKIPEVIDRVLDRHTSISSPSLEEILEADRWAREFTSQLL